MDIDQYQLKAQETALYSDTMYPVVSLIIEAAELADLYVKPCLRGDAVDINREEIVKEAGDVFWNLAALLTDQGILMSEVLEKNIQKLQRRQKNGTIQGSGER